MENGNALMQDTLSKITPPAGDPSMPPAGAMPLGGGSSEEVSAKAGDLRVAVESGITDPNIKQQVTSLLDQIDSLLAGI